MEDLAMEGIWNMLQKELFSHLIIMIRLWFYSILFMLQPPPPKEMFGSAPVFHYVLKEVTIS